MKLVYMGTPDIAVYPLNALINAGHEIVAVITREDKPRGRGYDMTPTPVKEEALRHGIEVIHPLKMKDPDFLAKLAAFNADAFIVIAYGRILPKEILDIPKFGCINIHASLLPSYRGAAPIQWAVIDGQKQTGITTMLMNEGLDTGDIIKQYPVDIADDETGGSLFDKLAVLAGEAIVDTLTYIEEGNTSYTRQGDTDTHYASMLSKEDGHIDWSRSAVEIERLIRGLNPWPSAYTKLNGKTLKLWKARVIEDSAPAENIQCGTVLSDDGKSLIIKTGNGCLEIIELQIEGKKRMAADAYLRGAKIDAGTVLGKD